MASFQRFVDEALDAVRAGTQSGGPLLGEVVERHLGVDPSTVPVVRLDVPSHQFVNLDVAVEALLEAHGGGELVGIGGGDQRHHQTFGDMLARRGSWGTPVGAVDRARVDTGPASSREAVALGVHLFHFDGVPVAALQRQANRQYDNACRLEVVAAGEVSEELLAEVRQLMVERSVFRGQVLAFDLTGGMYTPSEGGIRFLERPQLGANEVVLPDGTLARVERHVVGAVRHRDALRSAGQHLKRGLLLYGPPGTGKTHTVRYLLGALPGVTCVVLSGNALSLVSDATELAHALQPAVVILEDVDLIAEHREMHLGPQPLLFTLLDAMDGLTAEADVAFILTTNRADLLEAALSQRPGRVDLAVEIPLPDESARRALLGLYARDLPVTPAALDDAAGRCGGVTASFFKELARRTVLTAADADHPVDDAVLANAVTEMLSDSEQLTRALLGGAPEGEGDQALPGAGHWHLGAGPGLAP
jgi:ATPase family associated with various cellular activities (AAA)